MILLTYENHFRSFRDDPSQQTIPCIPVPMCMHNIISLQLDLLLDFIIGIIFSFLILLTASSFQIITTMRTLYQKCKLVHGDLSEYNILYFEVIKILLNKPFSKHVLFFTLTFLKHHFDLSVVQGHLYIIDVSQSVDLDHPSALDFLKEDCLHVSVSES